MSESEKKPSYEGKKEADMTAGERVASAAAQSRAEYAARMEQERASVAAVHKSAAKGKIAPGDQATGARSHQ